jgi:hypothetical protein
MRNPYDWIGRIGLILAIIGAVAWLVIGLFEYNFVAAIFGGTTDLSVTTGEQIVYIIVGIGGLLAIPMLAASLRRMGRGRSDLESRRRDEDDFASRRAA